MMPSMIIVFSDPNSHSLSIKVNPILLGNDFFITDVLGKIKSKGKFHNEITNLSTKDFNNGFYFLKVGKSNGAAIKFVCNNF